MTGLGRRHVAVATVDRVTMVSEVGRPPTISTPNISTRGVAGVKSA
jgi:hypothetical protein